MEKTKSFKILITIMVVAQGNESSKKKPPNCRFADYLADAAKLNACETKGKPPHEQKFREEAASIGKTLCNG